MISMSSALPVVLKLQTPDSLHTLCQLGKCCCTPDWLFELDMLAILLWWRWALVLFYFILQLMNWLVQGFYVILNLFWCVVTSRSAFGPCLIKIEMLRCSRMNQGLGEQGARHAAPLHIFPWCLSLNIGWNLAELSPDGYW